MLTISGFLQLIGESIEDRPKWASPEIHESALFFVKVFEHIDSSFAESMARKSANAYGWTLFNPIKLNAF
jgi:hypothetical protein